MTRYMAEAETGGTFRSGFACLVGRPNAGKSTLTNALVGHKVAITSMRPQTTRHSVRGIVNRPDAQLVLVDTPGMHRPRTLLGERLNDVVKDTLSEVDVIVLCLPSDQRIGPGDRFIAQQLSHATQGRRGTALIAVATKADTVDRERLTEHLLAIDALGVEVGLRGSGGNAGWDEIIPVSAVDGYQVEALADLIIARLPAGPALYPDGELTDEPDAVMVAELVREAVLEGVRDELPHSLAVVTEEIVARDDRGDREPLLDVRVTVYVERDSQKAIVIGKGGAHLREVGTRARAGIQELLGAQVYLDVRVKVAKDWQRDPKQLGRLGF